MDLHDREYVSAVINYFWGQGTATPTTVNESAAEIAYEALEKANVCSNDMDLVPRPAYGALGPSYAVKQLAKIGKRIISGDSGIYNACKAAVGLGYKSAIQIALMGG